MFRIAFDPDKPLVATSTFPDGTVQAGEVFDWRARGMQAIDAFAMFRSGLLAHPTCAEARSEPATSAEPPSLPRRRARR